MTFVLSDILTLNVSDSDPSESLSKHRSRYVADALRRAQGERLDPVPDLKRPLAWAVFRLCGQ